MHRVTLSPGDIVVHARPGTPVRELLRDNGVLVDLPCGGRGRCGQCRITIVPGPSSGKTGRSHLPDAEVARGTRLACRAVIEGDCVITVPQGQPSGEPWRAAPDEERVTALPGGPIVTRHTVSLDPPLLTDQRADWERLRAALESAGHPVDTPPARVLETLPRTLRSSSWTVDVVMEDRRLLACLDRSAAPLYGFAIDLGTTTVEVSLHSLDTGRCLGRRSALNRQVSYGADVISRAQAFARDRVGVRGAATATVQDCACSLLHDVGVSAERVVRSVVVGNPIMLHLLHDLDPRELTQAPYVPVAATLPRADPADLGWAFQAHGLVESLPLISAFVGADTVGMIVALGLGIQTGLSLSIDIGTNGEMVLSRNGRLTTTSTAAGPAFEGAQIECGMRARAGAVVGVRMEGDDLALATMDGAPPTGIAGTGLVSLVALLLDHGVLDPTGRLMDPSAVRQPGLRRCLRPTPRGEPGFHLTDDGQVYVSQRDIRELQLAKAAVRTGVDTLLREQGLSATDLDTIRLAGNFGGALDVPAAMRIGLIPPVPLHRVDVVGNAALRGAALALVSREHRDAAFRDAAQAAFLELAGRPEFQSRFAEALLF